MSGQTLPPSPRRQRDARAAGLRAHSPLLALAGAAGLTWGALELLARWGPGALALALARAFEGGPPPQIDSAGATLGLIGLLGGALVLLLSLGRRPSPRSLGVSPALGEIPAWVAMLGCVAALVLLAALLRPSVAASARAVDAELHTLWLTWWTWLGRGLAAVVGVALGLGLIERLVSARLLWQGLHLTREQARARARASGERRRRGGRPGSA